MYLSQYRRFERLGTLLERWGGGDSRKAVLFRSVGSSILMPFESAEPEYWIGGEEDRMIDLWSHLKT